MSHSDRASSEGYGRWLEIFVPGRICLMGESCSTPSVHRPDTRNIAHAVPPFGRR